MYGATEGADGLRRLAAAADALLTRHGGCAGCTLHKIAWDDLPRPLKQAIEARTGPITAVRVATAGQNSPLAAIIDAADGKVFAKGLPSGHRRVVTQAREAAVAPLVRDISPALLVQLMNALSAINVPDDPGPFKRAEDRWKPYVDDPAAASLFAGPALTHSDWTPDNVLVAPGRAWLIDWAWPTLGAAWTDPACWILRLIASSGHTASEAEQQAFRLPAFQAADPAHVDLFAAANVRLWDDRAADNTAWTGKMAQAAHAWAAYRQAR